MGEHPERPEGPEWVPLQEAVRRLGKSERTLRKHLKAGTLPGRQVRVRGVDEWRVCLPEGTPEGSAAKEEAAGHGPPEGAPEVPAGIPDALPELFRNLVARHEAASYRVGYLEAQLAQLPALTEGAAAAAERAARAEAQAAAERRRVRAWTVAAVLFALVAAVTSGMLLVGRATVPLLQHAPVQGPPAPSARR